ncbi:unnamed protein product [Moneuplotes crassus]|uniref:Uncharacterized protein n=1 Tax=Euplotes crassus TaxID=5936 RepID=A0AAD1X2Q8_EUPCR|nr:unnamed protein product [Moneuplotes crassus]
MEVLKPSNYPWRNEAEFQYLRFLFPEKIWRQKHPNFQELLPNLGKIEEACRLLKLWSKRTNNSMLKATYLIAKKIYQFLSHDISKGNDSLKDSLSVGVIRVVNIITDSFQKNYQGNKLSMVEIARSIKFPQEAVKIRNTISHSQFVPPLRQMVETYRGMYRWIYNEFWNSIFINVADDNDTLSTLFKTIGTLKMPNGDEFDQKFKEYKENHSNDPYNPDIFHPFMLRESGLGRLNLYLSEENIQAICESLIFKSLGNVEIEYKEKENFKNIILEFEKDPSLIPNTLNQLVICRFPFIKEVEAIIIFLRHTAQDSLVNTILFKTLLSYLMTLIYEEERIYKKELRKGLFKHKNFILQLKLTFFMVAWVEDRILKIDDESPVIMRELARLRKFRSFSFFSAFLLKRFTEKSKIINKLELITIDSSGAEIPAETGTGHEIVLASTKKRSNKRKPTKRTEDLNISQDELTCEKEKTLDSIINRRKRDIKAMHKDLLREEELYSDREELLKLSQVKVKVEVNEPDHNVSLLPNVEVGPSSQKDDDESSPRKDDNAASSQSEQENEIADDDSQFDESDFYASLEEREFQVFDIDVALKLLSAA